MVLLQSTFTTVGAPASLGAWSRDESELTWPEVELTNLLLRRLDGATNKAEVEWSEQLLLHALGRMSGATKPATQRELTSNDSLRATSSSKTTGVGSAKPARRTATSALTNNGGAEQWEAAMKLMHAFAPHDTEVEVTMALDLGATNTPQDRNSRRAQMLQVEQEIAAALGVDPTQVVIDEVRITS